MKFLLPLPAIALNALINIFIFADAQTDIQYLLLCKYFNAPENMMTAILMNILIVVIFNSQTQ